METPGDGAKRRPSQQTTGAPPADNRSAGYLRRVRRDELLPKPPAIRDSSGTEVRISPMPLAERVSGRSCRSGAFAASRLPSDGASPLGQWAVNIETGGRSLRRADSLPPRNAVRAAQKALRGAQGSRRFSRRSGKCCWTENTTRQRNSPTRNGTRAPSGGGMAEAAEAGDSPCVWSFPELSRSRTISARSISRAPRSRFTGPTSAANGFAGSSRRGPTTSWSNR